MRILLWLLAAAFAFPGVAATVLAVQFASDTGTAEHAIAVALAMVGWFPALTFAGLAWIVTLLGRMRAAR